MPDYKGRFEIRKEYEAVYWPDHPG